MRASQHWKSNYIHYIVWYENYFSFPNFSGRAVEVWEWINNFIHTLLSMWVGDGEGGLGWGGVGGIGDSAVVLMLVISCLMISAIQTTWQHYYVLLYCQIIAVMVTNILSAVVAGLGFSWAVVFMLFSTLTGNTYRGDTAYTYKVSLLLIGPYTCVQLHADKFCAISFASRPRWNDLQLGISATYIQHLPVTNHVIQPHQPTYDYRYTDALSNMTKFIRRATIIRENNTWFSVLSVAKFKGAGNHLTNRISLRLWHGYITAITVSLWHNYSCMA